MTDLETMEQALKDAPTSAITTAVYADALEEAGDTKRARGARLLSAMLRCNGNFFPSKTHHPAVHQLCQFLNARLLPTHSTYLTSTPLVSVRDRHVLEGTEFYRQGSALEGRRRRRDARVMYRYYEVEWAADEKTGWPVGTTRQTTISGLYARSGYALTDGQTHYTRRGAAVCKVKLQSRHRSEVSVVILNPFDYIDLASLGGGE